MVKDDNDDGDDNNGDDDYCEDDDDNDDNNYHDTDTEIQVRKQCWIDSSIVGFRTAIKNFGVGR